LVIRNWRPGDRFWPAHTRSEKKVKELLQERHLPAREKSLWPVALADDQLVWMRGFPVSTRHVASHEPAVVIEELPLASDRK
jgi:tRNA(Ile)-lysidine synthase